MAGASLLTLLDDIATLMDDVAAMTKLATKKSAGVLGDDLALNAQQVQGVVSDRELPVVWAVAKGSLVNKAILVPVALLLSVFAPWAITPLLMMGGAFLCYEGFEKVWEKLTHRTERRSPQEVMAMRASTPEDVRAMERDKIRGAIRTDFILSAEIVVIALGAIIEAGVPLLTRIISLAVIALVVSIGVYAFVALIVRLDDIGLGLQKRGGALEKLGVGIVRATPWLMRALGLVGTVAMFLVGGGIIAHNIPALVTLTQGWVDAAGAASGIAGIFRDLVVGVLVGAVLVAIHHGVGRLLPKRAAAE